MNGGVNISEPAFASGRADVVQGVPAAALRKKPIASRMSSDLLVAPAWATLVALLLSTQFLAEPFVWANYPADEIATAWLSIFRIRLIVT